MRLLPSGSRGVLVELDDLDQVMALHARLRDADLPGVVDLVPAARTVLLVLDPGATSPATVAERLRALPGATVPTASAADRRGAAGPDLVEVPVVYDGHDLAEVGRLTGWGADGVVARHTGTTWTVAFGGFAPGFAYAVADTGPRWQVPRRHEPRTRVPAGSVAVADGWTGVYPAASPGGWQLLGRTATAVWDLDRDPPALLRPAVRVRFVAEPR
ncbi:allophanate hydrolase subunit 1 [Jannaschia sp. R86511]|uniref:5-oxoprolinase subunit B family protein n=1 Tax=Jannaschia sp. R86511 TaxID=3093853 RepID=UPI0036D3CEE8